ncbi:MAG: MFS transporter [Promethearchaeota archaeon]|nr:MAG: MFS transporter [Candidatus Lokiarchaeota archaeon]
MEETTLTKTTQHRPWRTLNYNVKFVLIFVFSQSVGRGIWMGNVLSSYIYLISDQSNELLGWTSAATGIMMTLVVFPAGVLADHFRRDWILRIASGVGIISAFILFSADDLRQIIVALVFWGLYQGLTRPALEALFADSVPSGTRSGIYSIRQFVEQGGMMIGPLINIILFWILGDEWELGILKNVMSVGLIFSLISLGVMWFFKDKYSLGKKSESIISDPRELQAETQPEPIIEQESMQENTLRKSKSSRFRLQRHQIPYVLVGCNIIIGLGAGMTIKFFPIFFMEVYSMQPILVQFINMFTFMATGILGLVAQQLSKRKGRAQMIFGVQSLATICLAYIATYPPFFPLIIIFIARGALMNASQPLSRSILMDIVPKEKRGKWNSLEALAWGLFWNVSAVIGGYLIGSGNNFRLNFLVTAGIYVLGTLPLIALFNVVSDETHPNKDAHIA